MAPKPLTLKYLILRFWIVTLLTALAVGVVYLALEALLGLGPSTGGGVLIAIIPAVDAGNVFARHHNRIPNRGENWRYGAILLAAHLAFSVAVVSLVSFAIGGEGGVKPILQLFRNTVGVWAIGVIIVVYLMAIGFFFRIGAKSELRRAERAAAKDKQ